MTRDSRVRSIGEVLCMLAFPLPTDYTNDKLTRRLMKTHEHPLGERGERTIRGGG